MKPIKIKLDKTRRLILDEKAFTAFKAAGGDISKMLVSGEPNLWEMFTFLWACLIHEDSGLTIEGLMKLINLKNMNYVFEQFDKCVTNALKGGNYGRRI